MIYISGNFINQLLRVFLLTFLLSLAAKVENFVRNGIFMHKTGLTNRQALKELN